LNELRAVYISRVDVERSGAMLVCRSGAYVGVRVEESEILDLNFGKDYVDEMFV
jgi:hypothetical protein